MREAIRAIHEASRGTYGVPRVHAELVAQGMSGQPQTGGTADARGGTGRSEPAPRGAHHVQADSSHRAAPDRVERQFQADAPDRIWVADITYVPTWAGFLYLAVVLDVFSRPPGSWDGPWPIIFVPSWCSTR